MTLRNLARIGAAGALAVGGLGLAATPALAADVDFGVEVSGTTIAAGTPTKVARLTFQNNGTTKPDRVEITIDFRGLDAQKVAFEEDFFDDPTCSQTAPGLVTCILDKELIPAAGISSQVELPLVRKEGSAPGAAGKLKVSVKVAGDTVKANDSKTVDVTLEDDNGADVLIYAEDVTEVTDEGEPTGKAVQPGAVAPLMVIALNQGDMAAAGMKLQVKLPQQTSFAAPVDDCVAAADKRTYACTFEDATLVPLLKGEQPEELALVKFFDVRVSPDAKGPVSLKDGVVTATAIAQKPFSARQSKAAAELPKGFSRPTAAQVADIDIDRSDNTDGFAVLVAGTTGGNAGAGTDDGDGSDGNDDGGSGDGGSGDDGGLPLTGPSGLAIGGGGLATIALGLGLVLAARRRRVVLVTPGDER